jgi:hypothetical protein
MPPLLAGPGPRPLLDRYWPATFFYSDLSGDPRYWANREMCPFFGIDPDPNKGWIVVGLGFGAQ